MSKSTRALIPCLFDIPEPPSTLPGSQGHRVTVCHLVGEMLKATPKDRWAIAGEMTRLCDREVSKHMLDAYAAEGREEFNIPAYLIPPLEIATECYAFTRWLAEIRGGRLLVGREALNGELGRLERQRDETTRRIKNLRHLMGDHE